MQTGRLRAVLTLCLCSASAIGASVLAAKPPTSPAPLGTVYFICATEPNHYNFEDYVLQMKADGSAQAGSPIAVPVQEFTNDPQPSTKKYGTDQRRWWLVSIQDADNNQLQDVYATKNGVDLVRLTACEQTIDENGIEYKVVYTTPRWSNDGEDLFFSVIATRSIIDRSQPQAVLLTYEKFVCRCEVQAQDLESLPADFVPLSEGDPRLRPLVVYRKPQGVSGGAVHFATAQSYAWSANGTRLLIPFFLTGSNETLYSVDVSGVVDVPLEFPEAADEVFTSSNSDLIQVECSPPGAAVSRIAFSCGATAYTCQPDGSGLTTLATSAWHPMWSPDGKHIIYTSRTQKGLQPYKFNITRIPAGGGSAVNLTSNLDPERAKYVAGWKP